MMTLMQQVTKLGNAVTTDPQTGDNSPYPPTLYFPPKIRRKKFGLAGYQLNFDEELAAGEIPAEIRLIVKNCRKTFCIIRIFADISRNFCSASQSFQKVRLRGLSDDLTVQQLL